MSSHLTDQLGRPLRDLRLSVTDRCNFRCTYCMPRDVYDRDFEFLDSGELLSFEEIARTVRVMAGLGVSKVRITGGEPLLRRELEKLVAMLSGIDGIEDLTLTSNGSLLARKAQALKEAGLTRVTVSLDSLDDEVFRQMNDVGFPVARVLAGIETAREVGFDPIKVNVVVKRGVNEESILEMARHFHGTGVILRFIEFMDVGCTNGWRLEDVVPAAEILARIGEEFPLTPVESRYEGEVARRYRYRDGGGEIGLIASVTGPFCSTCTRLRISSDGRLFTCLFGTESHDLRERLRRGDDDAAIEAFLSGIWKQREDRYSELRTSHTPVGRKVEMPRIGG
jgi:cyclic pyranopterin phosphate synthase